MRLAWADPHGASRAKAVTVPAFVAALDAGYNINVATTTLDSANARTFSSFTRGGGMGLAEMTGSPNLTIVPDPATFRVLPWAPGVGWMLCDEYFNSGVPFHFSPRHLLRKQLKRLADKGMGCVVGLEVEWYLARVAQDQLGDENIGAPGRARPADARPAPVEPGFSYHSESNMDLMQPVLSALAEAFAKLDLPLRSVENEWGPGQVECTFAARPALEAADNLLLFRTATRQICRRMGYFATFMCRPALKGYYSSGWHLHQSMVDATSGQNLFMPEQAREVLSPLGRHYLGGLLKHAVPCDRVRARRPSTATGASGRIRSRPTAPPGATTIAASMLRVLGAPGDPATRIENRVGEPAANPYLYIASQIVAGPRRRRAASSIPGPRTTSPIRADRPLLPTDAAGRARPRSSRRALFRKEFGDVFVDYFLKLKRNEAGRFQKWLEEGGVQAGRRDRPSGSSASISIFSRRRTNLISAAGPDTIGIGD